MTIEKKPVWFVTGCSTGFGRELVTLLIDQGFRVVATARMRRRWPVWLRVMTMRWPLRSM